MAWLPRRKLERANITTYNHYTSITSGTTVFAFQLRMTSSKGKPTEPKLREEVKEKVKNETNKDGSGKGQWSAWKANKLSKEYEKEGGGYENEPGSKNEPEKGAPEQKSDAKKEEEMKTAEPEEKKEDAKKEKADKPKANSGKKATGKTGEAKAKAPKKEKKVPTEGTRKSSRIGTKRSAPAEEDAKEKAPAKKAKSAKK
ncbi:MAG: hypothetical protein FRX48_00089 [Lasallia pustulata]|uniref:Uncharacterized protein n=1 Tax=Lasallia pustulata TaxID=136370 RepID=A0A5M8PZR0_9LECA|nr:MAG: hypothetical protein FRX48_00089 [Lasallia pustulata]